MYHIDIVQYLFNTCRIENMLICVFSYLSVYVSIFFLFYTLIWKKLPGAFCVSLALLLCYYVNNVKPLLCMYVRAWLCAWFICLYIQLMWVSFRYFKWMEVKEGHAHINYTKCFKVTIKYCLISHEMSNFP